MLLNFVVGEDSSESLGLQRDPANPFWRRSALGVLWKELCWSWNSNTLATSCEELTYWKRLWCWEGLVSCSVMLTVCNPMDYDPPGSSVHRMLQARILEQVAIPFSMGSSWPRNRTQVSCIAGRFFIFWATREDLKINVIKGLKKI